MQADDTSNPGMLWVVDGARLWDEPRRRQEPRLRRLPWRRRSLHARRRSPLPGARSLLSAPGRPRWPHQPLPHRRTAGATAAPREGDDLLALTAFVAHQSRGLPIAPPPDPALEPFRNAGEALYQRRLGQLALSCAECHDRLAGARLGGNVVPEAHPTGYPVYRLEWQTIGSLQRRLRNCMIGVRAEPFAMGAQELVELELFLMERAAGLLLETPGVRP